ncbi:MAG: cellulase family glycosylhydrolase [Lachnospiraceae bacterium]|nr:cellulase family glycosylhydrolase [Lachnospiraceae bacterium]
MRIFYGYQKGVDLGGWFSQCDHSEQRYDTFITEKDFAVIKSWGCDHVRLPVDYELLEDKQGAPRETGYARLEKAIGWARENGLNMVLDLHKTAGFSFDPGEQEAGFFENAKYQERFCILWERIARRFGRDADMLAFELLNEVTEKEYGQVWNRILETCVRRIRVIAPDTKILIGGYWHNSAAAVKDLPLPFDENIVYNFHCYEPLIFTHQGAYWMPPMETSFRIPVSATYGEMAEASCRMLTGSLAGLDVLPADERLSPAFFEAFFREAVSVAEARNVPLYCGEYGVIDKAAPEDALVWYKAIHAAFEAYGIGRAAWSYRQMDFGLSDERMDGVREELLRCL